MKTCVFLDSYPGFLLQNIGEWTLFFHGQVVYIIYFNFRFLELYCCLFTFLLTVLSDCIIQSK